jgi:starvation-inducible DNA-binding protein
MSSAPLGSHSKGASKGLKRLIADNFVAYYKAHTFHLNVTGPGFVQYHELFGEVYDKLWDWHDTLSEQLRQSGEKYPFNLKDVLNESAVSDDAVSQSVANMFSTLCSDLDGLLAVAEGVYNTADPALETVVGDYCADVKKLKWKIDATIGK